MTYNVVFTPAATTNGATPGICIYDWYMRFIWDEAKPLSNLRDHEIDFVYEEQVPVRPRRLTTPKTSRSWTIATQLAQAVQSSQSRVAKMEAGDLTVLLDLQARSLLGLGNSNHDLDVAARAGACERGLTVPSDGSLSSDGLSSVADTEDLFD
jgi:hypothetical protein